MALEASQQSVCAPITRQRIMQVVLSHLSLQRQLSLSHLLVTLLTALILALSVLVGYTVYARSGQAARWLAEEALVDAEAIAGDHETRLTLGHEPSQAYIDTIYAPFLPAERRGMSVDEAPDDPEYFSYYWALVLAPDGVIVASNYQERYPVGSHILDIGVPLLKSAWLQAGQIDDIAPELLLKQGISEDLHVGFAPLINEQDSLLGWVYLRSEDETISSLIGDWARNIGLGLVAAMLIAVITASLAGYYLSKSFSRRLNNLSQLSLAYAEGDFSRSYLPEGRDEIAELGIQLNRMASQLDAQMHELRDLLNKNAQLAEESRALAVLEERNRLARDLHDAVKQRLFGLNLSVGALKGMLRQKPEAVPEQLKQLSRATTEVLEEMDTVIKQLTPVTLEERGLVATLSGALEQWSQQTGIPAQLTVSGPKMRLPLRYEQGLYRVVQEALQNVAKHAAAGRVQLDLAFTDKEVRLEMSDDGTGFKPQKVATGAGLRNIKARVEALAGYFEVTSSTKGTTLLLSLPYALEFASG